MQIQVDPSGLKNTKWYEYAVRFLFGGLITALTGVIAQKFGPVIGGLFLAFPAIFPASVTLIEKHEKRKKQKAGLDGTERGRGAASVDAAGAAIGSIGLLAFAWLVSRFIPSHNPWLILCASTAVWLTISVLIWQIRKHA
jgi:hypothetical protein